MTRDTVVSIEYHVNWPGSNDGFYLWNTSECQSRWTYYGVNGVPAGFLNGRTAVQQSVAGFRNQIRQLRAVPAPCAITMAATADGPTSVHVTGTITASDSAITGTNEKLLLAVITNEVHYLAAPGTNGITYFPDAFRDMWPNTNGQPISIAQGGTYQIDATLRKDALWSADSLSVIAIVQNSGTKWVHQAAWAPVRYHFNIAESCTDPRQVLADINGDVNFSVHLTNTGLDPDFYDVNLGTDLPEGWSQSVEADGIGQDPSHLTVPLASGEDIYLMMNAMPNGHPGSTTLTLDIHSQGSDTLHAHEAYRVMSGLDVLLVDDDGGANNYESYYLNALQDVASDRIVGRWDTHANVLDGASVQGIPMLVWFTGSSSPGNTLSEDEQTLLETYLNAGGKLFLSGQGIAFDLRNDAFLADVLHTTHMAPYPAGRNVTGIDGNSISGGMNMAIFGGDGADNQVRANKIRPADANATPLWNWQGFGGDTCAALQIQTANYRAVFLAFGLEAVDNAAQRDTVMARTLNTLLGAASADPREAPAPTEFGLGQNYPNPFNPETVIPYTLPVRANVSLRVFDILGRQVAVLASGIQEPGAHAVTWQAAVSSGLYFYRLDATSGSQRFQATRKLMFLK